MADFEMNIVVVEDDVGVRKSLEILLNPLKYRIYENSQALVEAVDQGLEKPGQWDLVLLDLCSAKDLKGEGSISRIPSLRVWAPQAEIIVQSGVSDIEQMRACVRNGANRFTSKESLAQELPLLLERVAEMRALRKSLDQKIIGDSAPMKRLKQELLALRFEVWDVLLEGETGAGKELCAQALNAGGPLISVNCSAIPADLFEAEFFGAEKGAFTGAHQTRVGYLEAASGGILFLDEIQSLAPAHQAKLLRALETRFFQRVGSTQDRHFRGRIVAASNGQLKQAAEQGRFREDLYYRLSSFTVNVPPLRLRGSDVSLLAQNFLAESSIKAPKTFAPEALRYLENDYDWPGNVRELRNLCRTLSVKCPIPRIGVEELKEALGEESPQVTAVAAGTPVSSSGVEIDWNAGLDDNVAHFEKIYLTGMIQKHPGNSAREKMKLARSRYYEKLKVYGLKDQRK